MKFEEHKNKKDQTGTEGVCVCGREKEECAPLGELALFASVEDDARIG